MPTTTDGTTDDAQAELLSKKLIDNHEWEFDARVRVRLHNPDGEDVIVLRTYQARPKFDDLTSDPEKVHEYAGYWWPDSYSSEGDGPFTDALVDWEPAADLEDDDALLAECVEENALYDPAAELDALRHNLGQTRRRLADRL